MASADSLDLRIRLDRSGLTSDLSSAQQEISKAFGSIKGPELKIGGNNNLNQLQADLSSSQARLTQGTGQGAAAAKEAARYQEAIRYAGQLEKINEAIARKELVGQDDIAAARALAN